MQRSGRIARRCAAALMTASLLPGCALFPGLILKDLERVAQQNLPPAAPRQDAIGVELFFVERPPGDLLMGDALWNELDQIGSVDPHVRTALQQNGLRFGIAGSNRPYALSTLISQERDEPGRRTLQQQFQIPSGVSQQIPCNKLPEDVEVVVHNGGETKTVQYSNGRAVIACRIERTQDGWARVDILPEFHHGQNRMRPQATDQSWDWDGGQAVDSLYQQRFSVELNEGEFLVLGAAGAEENSVGAAFFRPREGDQPIEKLLIIRLASISKVTPVRQE